MKNEGNLGIASAILAAGLILIASIAAAVIIDDSQKNFSTQNINKITDEILDEITNYIQIKDIIGKYSIINEKRSIQKIAILIKPLIPQNINISDLTIKLQNEKTITILYYSGQTEAIEAYPLFEHPIWKNMTNNSFSFIVILDRDKSLLHHNVLNDDLAYIIVRLPAEFAIKPNRSLTLTLFPLSGIDRTIILDAPFCTKQVVSFE